MVGISQNFGASPLSPVHSWNIPGTSAILELLTNKFLGISPLNPVHPEKLLPIIRAFVRLEYMSSGIVPVKPVQYSKFPDNQSTFSKPLKTYLPLLYFVIFLG